MCWCSPHAVQGSKFRVQVISDISIMYAKARAATRIFTLPPLCPWSSTATYNKKADYNLIGPPDPTSNIRPIKLKKPASKAEEELQKLQLQIWAFNHGFWKRHNMEFQECKDEFIKKTLEEKRAEGEATDSKKLTANELSVFYKLFLDGNYRDHAEYTMNWLRLHTAFTWLSLKVKLLNFVRFKK